MKARNPTTRALLASLCLLPGMLLGCATVEPNRTSEVLDPAGVGKRLMPSNHRQWQPYLAVLPHAEFRGNKVTIRNIRNCRYITEDDYIIDHYDRTFDLSELQSVDFIKVPFASAPSLAHTMLSFGFTGERYLAVSVEARLEHDETYSPVLGAMRQYELIYVLADERDVIPLRTAHRQADVYIYRTRATPEQSQALLVDVLRRVNKLAVEPEFYDTLINNCTTNIVQHVNRLRPGKVPLDIRVVLPGFSDQLAYDLGLLDTQLSLAETQRRAWVNELANRHLDSPDFSAQIRR